jgi:hypothetical protein
VEQTLTPTATPVGPTPTIELGLAPPVGPQFPPSSGGPPPQGERGLPWIPLLLGLGLSSLAASAFVLSRRGQRP